MPDIVVRPMRAEDADGFFEVMRLTYNNGDPVSEENRAEDRRRFVAEADGQIVGGFIVLDLTCTRGRAVMRCGGVAAVGVLPHVRTGGVGKAMMRYWVRQARSEGVAMASLYGFSERYYRQFGYEVCGKRLAIKVPADKMPRPSSDLTVRTLAPADWAQIDPCYRDFAHARSGLSLRDEPLWKRVLSEHRPLTIYAAGDPVEAYAVVSHKVDFWSTDNISDIAWNSPEGYQSILGVIRSLSLNKTAMTWFEPSDSPFVAQYLDTFVEVSVSRPIMYRVCDVPGAVAAMTTRDFTPFTIRLNDEIVPDNVGPWRIAPGGTTLSIERCEQAEIEVDVSRFAQILLGEPSAIDLTRNGLITSDSEGALEALGAAFPAMPVYCPDFF